MQEYLTLQHTVLSEPRWKSWSFKNVPGTRPHDAERKCAFCFVVFWFFFFLVSATSHWEGPFYSLIVQSSPPFPKGLICSFPLHVTKILISFAGWDLWSYWQWEVIPVFGIFQNGGHIWWLVFTGVCCHLFLVVLFLQKKEGDFFIVYILTLWLRRYLIRMGLTMPDPSKYKVSYCEKCLVLPRNVTHRLYF